MQSENNTINIELKHPFGLNANIFTDTGGTVILSAANPNITLVYVDCAWEVLNGSFYPTIQQNTFYFYLIIIIQVVLVKSGWIIT